MIEALIVVSLVGYIIWLKMQLNYCYKLIRGLYEIVPDETKRELGDENV